MRPMANFVFLLCLTGLLCLGYVLSSAPHLVLQSSEDCDNGCVKTDSFSIMSYNVWNNNPPWDVRSQMIADSINALKPDIVGFQEIRNDFSVRDGSAHQRKRLAELLPEYPYSVYQRAMAFPGTTNEEGLGVFSRYPILDWDYRTLPRVMTSGDANYRICIRALVQTPAGLVTFFVTHMTYDTAVQGVQALDLWRYMKQHEKRGVPQILVGDLNIYPEHLEAVEFFTGEIDLEGEKGDMLDTWPVLHPDDPGLTFSTWEPKNRCDRVFVRNGAAPLSIQLVGDKPNADRVYASDHRALFASFRIKP
eukprot:gnl/Hemi2/24260_TR8148_c0_g1_i2.p1 gnl/Hemi2/24260_TR8148_c0_g1~~gnl/Hemi2/24260_TR8148_c0_g1_i2.p1  ORF type:complete len:306 (-),score=19.76 gnl/Hemi2/24260_TR8148_c0_g1_i2:58-975(-)